MILKTKVFEFCNEKYSNLSELAQAMEISVSQIYRVRQGKRSINQKFLLGAIRAFPECKLDDLFYFASELPTVSNVHRDKTPVYSTNKQAVKEEQRIESTRQALGKFTSATDEYAQHLNSHISALISLNEASQELKKGAEETSKLLELLIGSSVN